MSQIKVFEYNINKARKSIVIFLLLFLIFILLVFRFGNTQSEDYFSVIWISLSSIFFAFCILLIYRLKLSINKENFFIEINEHELIVPTYFLGKRVVRLFDIYSIETLNFSNNNIGVIFGIVEGDRFILEKEKFKNSDDYELCINTIRKQLLSSGKLNKEYENTIKRNHFLFASLIFITILFIIYFLGNLEGRQSGDYLEFLLLGGNTKETILNLELYRVSSSSFLHSSLTHLLLNILMLAIFSELLEKIIGSIRFANIILLSSVLGVVWSSLFSDFDASVGISGGIFGLWGGYTYIKINFKTSLPGRFNAISLYKLYVILIFEIVLEIFFIDGIDYFNHIGGFIAGFIYFYFAPLGPKLETVDQPTIVEKFLFGILVSCYAFGLSYFLLLYYGLT